MITRIWENYSYTIILIATIFLFTVVLASELKAENREGLVTITITEGESLWKIEEKLSDKHNLTKQEFIAWVEEENGIKDGIIYAGDELVVPIESLRLDTATKMASINIE